MKTRLLRILALTLACLTIPAASLRASDEPNIITAPDVVQLGPDFQMPRDSFEKLSESERAALFDAVKMAESRRTRRNLVVGIGVPLAIVLGMFAMAYSERHRLDTIRSLAERNLPIPDTLKHNASGLSTLLVLEGGGATSAAGSLLGALMWIGFGIGAIALVHVKRGEVGVFWVFSVFIVVGLFYLAAWLRASLARK